MLDLKPNECLGWLQMYIKEESLVEFGGRLVPNNTIILNDKFEEEPTSAVVDV